MRKRKINVGFVDYWPKNLNFKNGLVFRFLEENYDVELSATPDYLFCFPYTRNHFNYKNCIKIFINPENHIADFNLYDYAVGFNDVQFGDRYVRVPNYTFYPEIKAIADRQASMPSDDVLLNRGFCSFVVSNADGDPNRGRFYELLSKYKKVSSGGRYLNNVGGPVADKAAFCSRFKFNIAFENSVVPGYTTEKLVQPFAYHTVPIYYGDPDVEADFNLRSFIQVNPVNIEEAVERVIALDRDDDAYLRMCKETCFLKPIDFYEKRLKSFLKHIFDQPFELAHRVSSYGHQREYQIRAERAAKFEGFFHPRIVSEIVKRRKHV